MQLSATATQFKWRVFTEGRKEGKREGSKEEARGFRVIHRLLTRQGYHFAQITITYNNKYVRFKVVCFARFNDYISPLLPYSFHHVVCLSLFAHAYQPTLQFARDNIRCILGKHPVQASSNLTIHHLVARFSNIYLCLLTNSEARF